jgi:hypothetical protein
LDKDAALKVVWQFEEWNPIYKHFRWGDMSDETSQYIERSSCPAPIMLLGFTQGVRRRYDTTGMKQYREHWAFGPLGFHRKQSRSCLVVACSGTMRDSTLMRGVESTCPFLFRSGLKHLSWALTL